MISDDSVVYRKLVPPMIKSLFGTDAGYSHTRALDSAQLKKLNFYVYLSPQDNHITKCCNSYTIFSQSAANPTYNALLKDEL